MNFGIPEFIVTALVLLGAPMRENNDTPKPVAGLITSFIILALLYSGGFYS